MSFTVVWRKIVLHALAENWMDPRVRRQIREIADRLDQQLSVDPFAIGESRGAGVRIVIEPPLAVLFKISEEDLLVTVWAVWRIR